MLTGGLVLAGWTGTIAGRRLVLALSEQSYVRVIQGLLFALSVVLIVKGVGLALSGLAS
jgi:uncharacterized protein